MKFDSLIIGGGVAGLSCAIRCAEAGLKTAVIAAGQSALHFSSGSIDILSHLPDGQPVTNPFAAFEDLKQHSPDHPYSKLGKEVVCKAINWYQATMEKRGVYLTGQEDGSNHYRITPMGTFRSTGLSQQTVHQFPQTELAAGLGKIALVTIDGFRDFQPQLAADNLAKLPQFKDVAITTAAVELPDFDKMQRNPCEFRSIDISRVLRDETKLHTFAKSLIQKVGKADLVVLPSIFGNGDGAATIKLLEGLTGFKICEIPTMPPSLLGIRLEEAMKSHFKMLGGLILSGDEVLRGEFEDGKLTRIYTRHHHDMPLTADHYLIATGSFFSRGMAAERHKIEEPVFGLDMTTPVHRDSWYQPEFFAKQSHPFMKMGVRCNEQLQPSIANQTISNLYCAGALLAHYDPVFEGCGSGVAISTGYYVAEQMIAAQQRHQTQENKQQERTFA
ncbi:glycerol-3-phosphate dehydrogenase subunit GlpB [uncultured Photobacterium sp.]|uniref:glycerol-3-phosphate dehydrogenase subunit GlpB n=1 Tax=uncultured Photobacterium sp. TaxID=173973 RepID=UPI00262B11AC|nr:glycerol-3-phosphate dehydrogenase subunit GlpB [uncultured Photobacterium sp.]